MICCRGRCFGSKHPFTQQPSIIARLVLSMISRFEFYRGICHALPHCDPISNFLNVVVKKSFVDAGAMHENLPYHVGKGKENVLFGQGIGFHHLLSYDSLIKFHLWQLGWAPVLVASLRFSQSNPDRRVSCTYRAKPAEPAESKPASQKRS